LLPVFNSKTGGKHCISGLNLIEMAVCALIVSVVVELSVLQSNPGYGRIFPYVGAPCFSGIAQERFYALLMAEYKKISRGLTFMLV